MSQIKDCEHCGKEYACSGYTQEEIYNYDGCHRWTPYKFILCECGERFAGLPEFDKHIKENHELGSGYKVYIFYDGPTPGSTSGCERFAYAMEGKTGRIQMDRIPPSHRIERKGIPRFTWSCFCPVCKKILQDEESLINHIIDEHGEKNE